MTAELVVTLLGGAGFLAGIAALLHFLNTRGSTRQKGSADAYQAWRAFMGGAFDDAARVADVVRKDRDRLETVRSLLIDLVQALIETLKAHRGKPGEIDAYQDRLDDIRRR